MFKSLLQGLFAAAIFCQVIGQAAIGQDQTNAFNVKQTLAEQKKSLPEKATFTIGESRAYRLVMRTKHAILDSQRKEVQQLEINRAIELRAFQQAVRLVANTVIPKNFLELESNRLKADRGGAVLGKANDNGQQTALGAPKATAAPQATAATKANPQQGAFDWRNQGGCTPVRDQDGCGSCWCFAAVAVYEGSHLIKFGGAPIAFDASEQEILNCGHTGGCNGDWYATAWNFMQRPGTATEKDVPYHGAVESCQTKIPKPYNVDLYGFVSATSNIPPVDDIKAALLTYGPLAVAVEVDEAFLAYQNGVFESLKSDGESVNHAVTLIGWDDSKGAWIIKNSWGTDWGNPAGIGKEGGYMFIKYDSNNIGYAAAWAVAKN